MDKFFEIKPDCKLYKEYFVWQEDIHKMNEAFERIRQEFGIETTQYYASKDCLQILPTKSDRQKFSNMLKKTSDGEFKKNSAPSKMWRSLTEDVKHFRKPWLLMYFAIHCNKWGERLFHIGDKLYCSIDCEVEVPTPDFAIEMKASEFFKIIEDAEEKEENDETN